MRKLLRVAGAIGLSITALVVVSTMINLAMGAIEKATSEPYGEGVSIDSETRK